MAGEPKWGWWRRLRVPTPSTPATTALPWWGAILSAKDKRVLAALLDSGHRLEATMQTPGWADVEAVMRDWLVRYTHEAGRLGSTMEERDGRMVLRDQDTTEDDRRRLIACAQAAALRGVLDELAQRRTVGALFLKRQAKERAIKGTVEDDSLV